MIYYLHEVVRLFVKGLNSETSGNAEEGAMYRTVFLTWLAAMVIFAADVIYVGWDLVAVAAGLR